MSNITNIGKNQHIVPHPKGWAVKGEGNQKSTKVLPTQADAAKAGREIAKNQQSELIIHSRNGQINRRNSYGGDPYPPEG